MSASATPPGDDPIAAATHALKLKRLAGKTGEKPGRKKGRKTARMVRCEVRLTNSEFLDLSRLKKQLARKGVSASKEELIRAGLLLLVHLDRSELKSAIRDVIAPEPATQESE
ncbi:MAG: hypothetical protein NOF05_00235 [Candidatus Accumulibacter phosphatis]|uniref:Uncharacterized protein n=2 Tax=Candidatus Accumulibacter TaxID=327159 RepID=A0A080M4A7_9PROT|nr:MULTISPECIES: hypothetical protein [Candidatus Accumulibacter]MCC2869120.1 hypothetical protein [Candidatus Accumulibacter phosphatis]KFB76018.1 MAG: hypothetical protein AW06_002815 [Candidatus Accumulibacter cognatus]MBL8400702.1 hypothetical protein [Accumulibacter sp.]MBN8516855.1 hypothetical protein [Accumulibacter sp.]MBO3710580.1 hypothetical protein [Accumulibacter sp.]